MKKCLIYAGKENIQDAIDLIDAADRLYGREAAEIYGFGDPEALQELEGHFDVLIRGEVRKDLENTEQASAEQASAEQGMRHDDSRDGTQGMRQYSGSEYTVIHEEIFYDIKNLTNCMEKLHRLYDFHSILIPADHVGRMLAPRLSMRLKTGLTADVTAIESDGENIELIRPAYSGKLMAAIKNRGAGPLMMSVRQKVFQWDRSRTVKSRWQTVSFDHIQEPGIKLLRRKKQESAADIRESEVLIAGGGGAARYFNELEALAQALKGQVAASRKIIDQDIAPRSIQVGQSGKTVSPKLYIAIGISGSIQHIEGLKTPEHVIAVNKKSRAPICSIADIVVAGDGKVFVEKLLERIHQGKNQDEPAKE